ncbi:hypothetical protein METBIDRAFT_33545 [Metschnikowia bicuspidata var. bicuspidata NRRL YB-4993]|uniref:Uncharacterized protein n=1 Tax=Metschnikowia bicuspidata var. bicuspidata NRRL YB-4993 TaxID=869754 RepID=A0A1A0H5K4_9ASCO|nr:hypothetical protein METBIDRAFT_33545 [Metschnikowia bicuspidata var. bicuspidata NRRL YB-4993]OBA19374.1 hypothetical protein METBIDRAFT_33545 [Metschnikowia bicuspidata var. bicuspidata NRRL YB-4993]
MIRNSPNTRILLKTEIQTTIFVKSSTPYVSALKRVDRLLEKFDRLPTNYKQFQQGEYKKVRSLSVKAMGSAMEKAVSIGLHFKENMGYQVDFFTGTVEVVDELKTTEIPNTRDDSEDETELRGRNVSCVQVTIWLKRK